MKRIQSVMLQQTLKFVLSDKLSHSEADDYVHQLERSGLKFSIISRKTDSDGAAVIEVKKQYNTAPTGDYI